MPPSASYTSELNPEHSRVGRAPSCARRPHQATSRRRRRLRRDEHLGASRPAPRRKQRRSAANPPDDVFAPRGGALLPMFEQTSWPLVNCRRHSLLDPRGMWRAPSCLANGACRSLPGVSPAAKAVGMAHPIWQGHAIPVTTTRLGSRPACSGAK